MHDAGYPVASGDWRLGRRLKDLGPYGVPNPSAVRIHLWGLVKPGPWSWVPNPEEPGMTGPATSALAGRFAYQPCCQAMISNARAIAPAMTTTTMFVRIAARSHRGCVRVSWSSDCHRMAAASVLVMN
jgi:hypothetical protein